MGRSFTAYTPAKAAKIVEFVGKGLPFSESCRAASVTHRTAINWLHKGRKVREALEVGDMTPSDMSNSQQVYLAFAVAVDVARGQVIAQHIKNVTDAGSKGQWQASAWFLERTVPSEFGRTDRHEVTGRDGGPVEIGQAEIVKQAEAIVAARMKELPQASEVNE